MHQYTTFKCVGAVVLMGEPTSPDVVHAVTAGFREINLQLMLTNLVFINFWYSL